MSKENLETAPNLNFIFCSHPLDKKKVDEKCHFPVKILKGLLYTEGG